MDKKIKPQPDRKTSLRQIPHTPDANYHSTFATGAVLFAGDGMHSLLFFEECPSIAAECVSPDGTTWIPEEAFSIVREDKVRVVIGDAQLRALYLMLKERFEGVPQEGAHGRSAGAAH